jgi:hypothetical protein
MALYHSLHHLAVRSEMSVSGRCVGIPLQRRTCYSALCLGREVSCTIVTDVLASEMRRLPDVGSPVRKVSMS